MTSLAPAQQLPVARLELHELRPFVSLLLLQSEEDEASDALFRKVVQGCSEVSRVDTTRKRRLLGAQPKYENVETVQTGAIIIEEHTVPAWTANTEIRDIRNHVVVVVRLGNFFGIHSSDSSIRDKIAARVGDHSVPGLGSLAFISQGIMNAAFVHGVTRTVWLRGIHHPTSLKSDTKMLSGADLGDAIDPLGDQTYHFTAVRCSFDDGQADVTIGVAPADSRVWISRPGNWDAFRAATVVILTTVSETTRPSFAPIRFLAVPGSGGKEVNSAFDMGFYLPEIIERDGGDNQNREDRERIATQVAFSVIPQVGPNLSAIIHREGVRIGSISLHFEIEEEHVFCNAQAHADHDHDREDVEKIQRYCEERDMLVVRYDSEHVISGGLLYRYRFRDNPFSGYEWVDLTGWTITDEKPSTLDRIGDETSLFCWVWGRWSGLLEAGFGGGWLACDDGAGEKADFIHFDEEAQVLTLIHVKASDSASPNRSVAVATYEVVVSQAIKNLRFLDRENLQSGLLSRLNGDGRVLTWRDGTGCDRADFIEALSRMQPRCSRRVVIVQPHLQKAIWERAAENPESQAGGRLRQLNSLLNGIDTACRGLGASLTVTGAS
ncbi:MAG TPA: hypothetical protein VF647_10270 [Longimicrobium sp.]|jgi:hypothetical protein